MTLSIPRCCCCDLKTGLLIYFGICIVGAVFQTFRSVSTIFGVLFYAFAVYGVYSEKPGVLKVVAGLNIAVTLLVEVLLGLFIGLTASTKSGTGTSTTTINGQTTTKNLGEAKTQIIIVLVAIMVIYILVTGVVTFYLKKFWNYLENKERGEKE